MKMSLIFISIFFLLCCSKREPVIPIPTNPCLFNACDTSKLEIIWQKPITTDTSELISIRPYYFENNVLFSRSTFEENIDTLKLMDSKTGVLKWQWSDYLVGSKPSISHTDQVKFFQSSKFLFTNWKDVYCVDAMNGKSIWRNKIESGEGHPRITVINDFVYHSRVLNINSTVESSYLVRANINEGKWDTAYTQAKTAGFEPRIEPPSISWKNSKNEEVIFFQIRYWDFAASKGRIDWLAFNIHTNKQEFRLDSIDRGQIGNVAKALISSEHVFFLCVNSLFCINKYDGTIKWSKYFDNEGETFTSTSPFIAEGKLFIKPDNRTLYALDPNTGTQIWVDKDNGSSCSDLSYYNGFLYYSCKGNAKLYAIEASTGKKIWAEPSPNRFKNKFNGNRIFNNANIGAGGVAIDTVSGYLYTSDYYFQMCLKLPKK